MLAAGHLTLPQNIHKKSKRIQQYIFDTQTLLGKGCFSTVHPGHHTTTNSNVAIKVVKLSSLINQKMNELLDQETQIICSLNHPNIIRCYQVLRSDNHCYFVTQICEQGTLQQKLRQKTMYGQDEVRPLLLDIYQGLKYLEAQGIVHRDLKLANVFLREGVAKIADFGFAVRTRNQFKDIKIGSPLYMAPQSLLHGLYSPQSDIWSFGILIYELLHGRTPLSHCRSELDLYLNIDKQINVNDLRSDLSAELKELIVRCLQVRCQDRISTIQIEDLAFVKNYSKKQNMGRQSAVLRCLSPSYRPLRPVFSRDAVCSPKNQLRSTNKAVTFFRSPPHSHHLSRNDSVLSLKTLISHNKKDPQVESSTASTISTNSQTCLLKGKIHFKECVGLIHFCRLAFRLLDHKLSSNLPLASIKGLVCKILQDLQVKLKQDDIVFSFRQLQQRRDIKLRQVISQYQQRCKLSNTFNSADLTKLISTAHQLDSHNPNLMKQDAELHLFLSYCSKLQTSINQLNYIVFSQEIDLLQSCLQRTNYSP